MSSPNVSNIPSLLLKSVPFVVFLVVGVAGFIGLSKLRTPPDTRKTSSLAPLVQTIEVQTGSGKLGLEVDGEAIPFRQISLAAQVAGQVILKEDRCRAGQFVKAGERLLQIDPQDYDIEIERTQKLIQQTEVSIEELDVERMNAEELIKLAEEDLALQEREVKRVISLINQRATSQSALDAARRSRIQAVNALKQLENQRRLLITRRGRFVSDKDRYLVDLKRAKLDRSRCDVTAPMDGVIISDPIEKDDYVQRGAILVQIEDTTEIEVRFDLKLDQLRWLWGGRAPFDPYDDTAQSYTLPELPVEISIKSEGHRYVWDADLSRYDGGGLNARTRTVPCIATVKNPRASRTDDDDAIKNRYQQHFAPPALLRGMYVKVWIAVPTDLPLLELPAIALRPGNRVWLAKDDKLDVIDVNVAQMVDDRALIFANDQLQNGDRVVISPLSLAVNGMDVRIEASQSSLEDDSPTATVAEIDSSTRMDDVIDASSRDRSTANAGEQR